MISPVALYQKVIMKETQSTKLLERFLSRAKSEDKVFLTLSAILKPMTLATQQITHPECEFTKMGLAVLYRLWFRRRKIVRHS